MADWFYVKVETSPGHWIADFFGSEADCKNHFAEYPLNSAGFLYHWEAISEEEFEKRRAYSKRHPFAEYQAETA